MLPQSGCRPIIIVQQPAQTLLLLNDTEISHVTRFRAEELIAETLMRTFPIVMGDELGNSRPQRLFSE